MKTLILSLRGRRLCPLCRGAGWQTCCHWWGLCCRSHSEADRRPLLWCCTGSRHPCPDQSESGDTKNLIFSPSFSFFPPCTKFIQVTKPLIWAYNESLWKSQYVGSCAVDTLIITITAHCFVTLATAKVKEKKTQNGSDEDLNWCGQQGKAHTKGLLFSTGHDDNTLAATSHKTWHLQSDIFDFYSFQCHNCACNNNKYIYI